MTETDQLPPNHHADYPGFAGVSGLLAALSMSRGRADDAALAIGLTGLAPGDHLVDIGCGPGRAARLAASHGAAVVAVDPARVMLRVARLLTRRSTAISWRVGAAEALPVEAGAADVVWSLSAVHHWADVEVGLREAWRSLRPGGRFLAVEHAVAPGADGLASHGWTPAQAESFASVCRRAGFGEVEVSHHPTVRRPAVAVRGVRPHLSARLPCRDDRCRPVERPRPVRAAASLPGLRARGGVRRRRRGGARRGHPGAERAEPPAVGVRRGA